MKARILVACVGIPLLLVIIFLLPTIFMPISVAILSVIAVHELLYTTGIVKKKRIVIWSMLFAAVVPFWCYYGCQQTPAVWAMFSFFLILFLEALADHEHVSFEMISGALFASILIPFFLSAMVRIFIRDNGRLYVVIPFVIAFVTDAAAYFVGIKLGRHKLAPVISPKKTVEGSIGGFVGGIIGMVIYGLVMQLFFGMQVSYFRLALYGLIGALVSQVGDLAFSLIKREYKVKDYGNILPGHGGVLDRFDSVIFVSPLAELMILILPAMTAGAA